MRPVRSLVGWPEVAALSLLALWVLWSLVSTLRSDWGWAGALPYVLCPVVLVLGVVSGTWMSTVADSRGMRLGLLVAAAALVLGVLLVREPGKDPLGYPNANAALGVQLVALCGLALVARGRGRRLPLLVALVLSAAAVGLNRSAAGTAVVVPVTVVVALAVWRRPRRVWWSMMAVVVGAASAAGATAAIVLAAMTPEFPAWAVRAFDPVREELWQDAVSLWRRAPVDGSGPGSFSDATELSVDPDTLAAHSSVLQVGAETGAIGVAFLALVAVVGLLWAARGAPAAAVIGVTAWSALLVHSTVDHLIEFGWVVLVGGAVIGWSGAPRASEQLDVTEREGPLAG